MNNIKKGYKNTEIGVIPEDWIIKPFKESSYMKGRIGWQGLKQTEFTSNMDEPFLITGMNFKDGEIRWDEVYHISYSRYEISKEIQLKPNDVLITKDGTIGKLLFITNIPYPYKASLNSHLLVFRPIRNSYIPKFLYYQLDSKFFKDYIELSKSGTTFFGVSQEAIGNYSFILPPLPEQKAIAEVLSDTDNLIQTLEKQIAKKRLIKQGAMQKLLSPKEGWEVKKLGEIAYFSNGKAHEQFIDENGDFTVINSKFVSTSGQIYKNATVNLCPLKKGDIAMVMSDIPNGKALAKCFIVPMDNKYALNQRICSIRTDVADNIFLAFILNRNKYYLSFDSGTGQTNLKKNDVLECPIPLPSTKEEQTHIATILSDMDNEIETLEKKLAKYKEIKQGLMQNLLTGKIRLI